MSRRRPASRRSPTLTILYRSNTLRVLCPVICIATRSGMRARTRLRTAVLRKSCSTSPGHPARAHAVRNATRSSGWAAHRDGTRAGRRRSAALQVVGDGPLRLEQLTQFARHRKRATLPVLRAAWIEADFAGGEIDLAPFERQHFAVDS